MTYLDKTNKIEGVDWWAVHWPLNLKIQAWYGIETCTSGSYSLRPNVRLPRVPAIPQESSQESFGFMLYYIIQIQSRINWQVSMSYWRVDTFTSAKLDFTFLILLFPMKLKIQKQEVSSSKELVKKNNNRNY